MQILGFWISILKRKDKNGNFTEYKQATHNRLANRYAFKKIKNNSLNYLIVCFLNMKLLCF